LDPTSVIDVAGNPGTGSSVTRTYTLDYCSGAAATRAPFAGGSGTTPDPYRICTAAQLAAVDSGGTYLSNSFVLLRDVDVSGYTFRIGNPSAGLFSGKFDGKGHVVSNFTYADSSQEVGLFNSVGLFGTVTNLTMTNANIVGGSGAAGILAGSASFSGSIINCHTSGTVVGSSAAGGLVGYLGSTSSLSRSSSSAAVSGYFAGGLVGQAGFNATISDSYATGAPLGVGQYGGGSSGGLVGVADDAVIKTSYATGLVAGANAGARGGLVGLHLSGTVTVTDSFWDIETSGQATSVGGGTGKTTALMKTASTFLDTGWSTSTWTLVDGAYPTLLP
jgi:hypothetical protein